LVLILIGCFKILQKKGGGDKYGRVAICCLVVILFLFICLFSSIPVFEKIDYDYFLYVYEYKKSQLGDGDFFEIAFGSNLSGLTSGEVGGDFVLWDAVDKIGLFLFLEYFAALYLMCQKANRWLLVVGFLSSVHYGVLYSLVGQFIFAAIMTGSVGIEFRKAYHTEAKKPSGPMCLNKFW